MVELIQIHEDHWSLRNVYPLAARAEVVGDMEDAAAAGERDKDPSGEGWSGIHVIRQPSASYVETGLLLAEAAAALEKIAPRVKRFYASSSMRDDPDERDPWGSYEEDAWCFGFGAHCYLKLEASSEHVERIWFELRRGSSSEILAFRQSIEAIDRMVPSFVADYVREVSGAVRDAAFLDRYLGEP